MGKPSQCDTLMADVTVDLCLGTAAHYPAVKLDWEAQTVLADLRPFLKAHMDDTCSPAFLEAIRRLTMQLVPHQGQPTFYFEGQLDPLLEDALLKFQGCRYRQLQAAPEGFSAFIQEYANASEATTCYRLSDVNDELLSVIAEVLQSELIFLRHINHTNENDDDTNKMSGLMLEPQESTNSSGQQHTKAPTQLFLGTESNTQLHILLPHQMYHSPVEGAIGPEAYNGDLAEADQSRHEETEPCLLSGFLLEEAQQVVAEEGEEDLDLKSHVSTLEEKPVAFTTGEQLKTEGEEWEQEEGLDRVPTRLNIEEEAEKTILPTSTNTRKGSGKSHEFEDVGCAVQGEKRKGGGYDNSKTIGLIRIVYLCGVTLTSALDSCIGNHMTQCRSVRIDTKDANAPFMSSAQGLGHRGYKGYQPYAVLAEQRDFHTFSRVFFYCFTIIALPLSTFFICKTFVCDGILQLTPVKSNVYSAVSAVVALHIALGLYIYRAYTGDSSADKPAAKQD
uniref:Vacuolar ATPase assembly integral membrane protein VMA21 homolog n=1 Tax=Timema bartmani TaxID=61472 RepID=A0A7R9I2L5_9NEOP|nr:unnamed protein product [Timema bartmani]